MSEANDVFDPVPYDRDGWQTALDAAFPGGASVYYQGSDGGPIPGLVFHLPSLTVVGMQGGANRGFPVLYGAEQGGVKDKFVLPSTWRVRRTEPVLLIEAANADHDPDVSPVGLDTYLISGVTDYLRSLMDDRRVPERVGILFQFGLEPVRSTIGERAYRDQVEDNRRTAGADVAAMTGDE